MHDSSRHLAVIALGSLLFACLLLLKVAEPDQHAEIFERGSIAGALNSRCDVPQQASHDLAAPSLGESVREVDIVWPSECSDLPGHVVTQLVTQDFAGRVSRFEGHEGDDIPYSGISETSSNCWKFCVIDETGCWEHLAGRASRISGIAA